MNLLKDDSSTYRKKSIIKADRTRDIDVMRVSG